MVQKLWRHMKWYGTYFAEEEVGQSTVEFAIVFVAISAVLFSLIALWHAGQDGDLIKHHAEAASHVVSSAAGVIKDVSVF